MKTLILASLILSAITTSAFAVEETPCTYSLQGQVSPGLESLAEELKTSERARLSLLQCTEVKSDEAPKYILVHHLIAEANGGNLIDAIFLDAGGKIEESESFYKKTKTIEDRIKEFRKRATRGARFLVDNVEGRGHLHPDQMHKPGDDSNE
jgi:hypothetical protein